MKHRVWALVALLPLLLSVGCAEFLPDREPAGPVEIERPELLEFTSPSTGATEVGHDQSLLFLFSEKIETSTALGGGVEVMTAAGEPAPGSFQVTNSVVIDSTPVDTVISGGDSTIQYEYDLGWYLEYTPATPFAASTTYDVFINGVLEDLHGNSLSIDEPVVDSSWYYTAGDYSVDGWYPLFVVNSNDEIARSTKFDSSEVAVSGLESASGIAVSGDGSYVGVTNTVASGYVSLFGSDLAGRTDVPVGAGPRELVMDNDYAYVVNFSGSSVSSVELASGSESSQLTFSDGFRPLRLAIDPSSGNLLVTSGSPADAEIVKILSGGANLAESATVQLADAGIDFARPPAQVAVHEGEAFLLEDRSTRLVVISTSDGSLLADFNLVQQEIADGDTTEFATQAQVMGAANGMLYVLTLDAYLIRVDMASRTVVDVLQLPTRGVSISFTPEADLIYLADNDDVVSIYEPYHLRKVGAVSSPSLKTIAVGKAKP